MKYDYYKFELKPLPYNYNSLEPYIDTLTMQIHHDRHLKTYVDNLNAALKDYPQYHSWSLEKLIKHANRLPEKIRTPVKNNAGGVYNHNFYFMNMANDKKPISTGLTVMINETFGNYDAFKSEFKKRALEVFGSGYAWLTLDKHNVLSILKTANQDTPLTLDMYPILVIDVWEHAYYLKHYNKRADYVDDWFNVVGFTSSEQFDK